MLKKARMYNPSNVACTTNEEICCSVCKTKSKSLYYLCKSRRHVICGDCNKRDSLKNRNDDGDNVPDKESDTSGGKEISDIFNSKLKPNLASGDHIVTTESLQITQHKYYISKSQVKRTAYTPKSAPATDIDTTVKYKNDKFNTNQSSVASSNILLSNSTSKDEKFGERVARPVKCPITHCAKMVIIASFFKHFNFDHSKVPRVILTETKPQEILINYSTLSTETKCLAILILPHDKRRIVERSDSPTSLLSLDKSDQFLFLMAAKIEIPPVQHSSTQCASTRNCYTQTDHAQYKPKNKKCCPSKPNSEDMVDVPNSHNEEVLLLWLCSLDNKERVFTVTISRTNKQQGYSYIGNAIHIREQHDPYSIYNSAQCLSIRKVAVEKLVTENELKVLVVSLIL